MVRFIDAWVKETGKKLDDPIPDTWIPDGVTPHLTDVDPNALVAVAPSSPTEAAPPPVAESPVPDSPNTEEA